jgi:hypothetical protein
MAEIPFALWLSSAYRAAHPAYSAQLAQGLDRPFVSSDLIDAVTDLARLGFPGMDETRSLFSDKFATHTRITADRDYDVFKAQWQPDQAHADGVALLACADMADSALGIGPMSQTAEDTATGGFAQTAARFPPGRGSGTWCGAGLKSEQ